MHLHSIEAERNVIGGILLDSGTLPLISGTVDVNDFFDDRHRQIFGAISELDQDDQPIDVVTVAAYMEEKSLLGIDGLRYIAELHDKTAGTSNITTYASIVRDRARKRELVKVCQSTLEDLDRPDGKSTDEIISETQTAIDELLNQSRGEYKSWMDVLCSADQSIQDALTRKKESRTIGIPTGLPALDNRTGGLIGKFFRT